MWLVCSSVCALCSLAYERPYSDKMPRLAIAYHLQRERLTHDNRRQLMRIIRYPSTFRSCWSHSSYARQSRVACAWDKGPSQDSCTRSRTRRKIQIRACGSQGHMKNRLGHAV